MRRRRQRPGPGQESVWDYPRPPAVEPSERRIRVLLGGETIADTTRAMRVLETSHPPVYYLPRDDIAKDALSPGEGASFCEWKGAAAYLDVAGGDRRERSAAWTYPAPVEAYAALRDHVAFYPSRMEACLVDDERAQAQEGDFYGGWITSDIVGPFKGGPGSFGW